jgi:hypothetical protein
LDEIQYFKEELDDISKRLQTAESAILVADALRAERHQYMIDRFERLEVRISALESKMTKDMDLLLSRITELQDLASQGKTSLKTLWVLGGMVAGGLALLAAWFKG